MRPVMDVIGEAWNVLKPQIGMWIAATLIYFVIAGIFSTPRAIVQASIQTQMQNGQTPSPGASILVSILGLLSWVVSAVLSAGLIKMAIHQVRTGRADIGEMFSITSVIGSVLIAALLTTIATVLGLCACGVGAIIVGLGLLMTNPLIVDQQANAIDAIKRSWDVCKGNLGGLFVLSLVLGLINIGGACACGVGLFVTFPLSQIAIALVYRDLFLGGTMAPQTPSAPNYPPPPIASPG